VRLVVHAASGNGGHPLALFQHRDAVLAMAIRCRRTAVEVEPFMSASRTACRSCSSVVRVGGRRPDVLDAHGLGDINDLVSADLHADAVEDVFIDNCRAYCRVQT